MSQSQGQHLFVPKQAYHRTPGVYAELTQPTTTDVAHNFLTLLPSFRSDSVIHDNGCGEGEVTKEIMAKNPPRSIAIKATDVNQSMISSVRDLAESRGWPVEAMIMPAESLTFPDNYFTHSFTKFVIPSGTGPANSVTAAGHIYRTLQPGGTVVVTYWAKTAHGEAVLAANEATRGPGVPLLIDMGAQWEQASYLKGVLEKGGFETSKIEMSTTDVYKKIHDVRRWATILWSTVGATMTGWTKLDEENWEKAVDVLVENLQKSPN